MKSLPPPSKRNRTFNIGCSEKPKQSDHIILRSIQPKFCSRKCVRCVDARCVGGRRDPTTQTALCRSLRTRGGRSVAKPRRPSRNVGAPGRCVEALDELPMPLIIDADGVLANAIFWVQDPRFDGHSNPSIPGQGRNDEDFSESSAPILFEIQSGISLTPHSL